MLQKDYHRQICNQEKTPSRNIGIDILRIWMCIEVVFCHCYGEYHGDNILFIEFLNLRQYAVPIFMIISFYLFAKYGYNETKCASMIMWKRLKRLLVPQIVWTLLIAIPYIVLFHYGLSDIKISLYYFVSQLLFGNTYNAQMWFVIALTVLTVLHMLFFSFCKHNIIPLAIIGIIMSFTLQYTGILFSILGDMNIYNPTAGRILEMIPYASFGLILYWMKQKMPAKILTSASIIAFTLWCIFHNHCSDVLELDKTYYYGGCCLFIKACMFSAIFIDSGDMIHISSNISMVISWVSKYTFGVYCIHVLVGTLITIFCQYIMRIQIDEISLCMATFSASLMLSYAIHLLPFKVTKMITV